MSDFNQSRATQTPRKKSHTARELKRSIFLWNPLITALLCLPSASRGFFRAWAISLFIAQVVCLFCFSTVWVVKSVEGAYARLRGRMEPERGVGWTFLLSCLAMPFGLHLAIELVAFLCGLLQVAFVRPDFSEYQTPILVGLLLSGIFFLSYSRSEAREKAKHAELQLKTAENERLRAQVIALTSQMNPHLLFNGLNTIASLISTSPAVAEQMVLHLAELYRAVLKSKGEVTCSLQDELQLCRSYLEIEKARFGEWLQYSIDLAIPATDASSIQVPLLLLQSLVENAIHHGLSAKSSGGRVWISVRRESDGVRAVIEDDGPGLGGSTRRGAGLSLVNGRERLRLIHADRGALDLYPRPGGGTCASVLLPISSQTLSLAVAS